MRSASRLLYYDTSETSKQLVRQVLGNEFQLTETNSRSEVRNLLGNQRFDLVLAGLDPGAIEDLNLLDWIHKEYPDLPVVVATENAKDDAGMQAMRRGAADYVVKTHARIQRLPYSIRVAIEKSRLRAEREHMQDELQQLTAQLEQRIADRTAELAEANQELEAFSYSVSHDLRAPLRAIEGFARILMEDHAAHLNADARRCIEIIVASTEQMNRLIEDLLAFSRLTRAGFATQTVDMTELARSVAAELQQTQAYASALVEIPELPSAHGDSSMLRQVLVNLIGNALKFSRTQAQPRVEMGSVREGGEQVYWVKDNGVGFDEQYVHKLFNVFQRLHRSDQFEGTGVGLAIVKRIILRHGGRTWAEAKLNAGATFYFSLPVTEDLPVGK
jgi:signal transduction histidine kinase